MTGQTFFGQAGGGTFQNDPTAYTLGIQFEVSESTTLAAIWFNSPVGAGVLPQEIALFAVSGAALIHSESASWSGAAGSGWVRAAFASPPQLNPNTAYKACVLQDTAANWYGQTTAYWSSGAGGSGLTAGILTAPNNSGGDGGQDTFHAAAVLTYPGTSSAASNYWIDPEVVIPPSSGGMAVIGALKAAGVL